MATEMTLEKFRHSLLGGSHGHFWAEMLLEAVTVSHDAQLPQDCQGLAIGVPEFMVPQGAYDVLDDVCLSKPREQQLGQLRV